MKKKLKLKRKPEINHDLSDNEDDPQDLLDMVEDDDLEFIKNSITSKSYNIFNKIKYSSSVEPKTKRRKINNGESHELEETYEQTTIVDDVPKKSLLPIKTKHGIIRQEIIDESADNADEPDNDEDVGAEDDNSTTEH